VSELFGALRREGFEISTVQAIDALRALEIVGLEDRADVESALALTLVERASDRAAFHRVFAMFFSPEAVHASDLWGRLAARGFSKTELSMLRDVLDGAAERSGASGDALRLLAGDPGELDHLLRAAGVRRALAPMHSPAAAGFFAQEVERLVGISRTAGALARIGQALTDAFGAERGDALLVLLRDELAGMRRRVRAHVEREPDRKARESRGEDTRPLGAAFASLDPEEARLVRRALRSLAERLGGGARLRSKRARRGKFDARATIRRAMQTGGVPMVAVRRKRRMDAPRLIVVCDVSESVRQASRFMLELVSAMQELFTKTRSFVFVSDLAETTALFDVGPDHALAEIASGAVVGLTASSHYGRAFAELERRLFGKLDRRDTIVVLGDGRTNHHADGAEVVARLRDRAGALYWLSPEPASAWGAFDSAMPRFAKAATRVLPARTALELERAARLIVRGARSSVRSR